MLTRSRAVTKYGNYFVLGEVAAGNRVADALPITRATHCGSAHADGAAQVNSNRFRSERTDEEVE